MFDPTIFDNLKVVLEGTLYDLDRDGWIRVLERQDLVDLASMSRMFSMRYQVTERPDILIDLRLSSELRDFADELVNLRIIDRKPGCTLKLQYTMNDWLPNNKQLVTIQNTLLNLWEEDIEIQQTTLQSFQTDVTQSRHEILITLKHRVDESDIEQLPSLIDHTIHSIEDLVSIIQ